MLTNIISYDQILASIKKTCNFAEVSKKYCVQRPITVTVEEKTAINSRNSSCTHRVFWEFVKSDKSFNQVNSYSSKENFIYTFLMNKNFEQSSITDKTLVNLIKNRAEVCKF